MLAITATETGHRWDRSILRVFLLCILPQSDLIQNSVYDSWDREGVISDWIILRQKCAKWKQLSHVGHCTFVNALAIWHNWPPLYTISDTTIIAYSFENRESIPTLHFIGGGNIRDCEIGFIETPFSVTFLWLINNDDFATGTRQMLSRGCKANASVLLP